MPRGIWSARDHFIPLTMRAVSLDPSNARVYVNPIGLQKSDSKLTAWSAGWLGESKLTMKNDLSLLRISFLWWTRLFTHKEENTKHKKVLVFVTGQTTWTQRIKKVITFLGDWHPKRRNFMAKFLWRWRSSVKETLRRSFWFKKNLKQVLGSENF